MKGAPQIARKRGRGDEDGQAGEGVEFTQDLSLVGAERRRRHASVDEVDLRMELAGTVACGRGFSVAIDSDGRVCAWGKNSAGQLGMGSDNSDRVTPTQVMGFEGRGEKFVGVACGNFHALAFTEEGDVYAWGSNARGRLGAGRSSAKEGTPMKIPRNIFNYRRVVAVACGLHHSIFLLDDGNVYSAGCNENGQLGRMKGFAQRSASGYHDPELVSLPLRVRVVRIASGRHHVLALTSEGDLLGWGKNDVGQLGILQGGPGPSDLAIPSKLSGGWKKVAMFDCGRNHSVVISSDDLFWVFGQNVDLQLGFSDRQDRLTPVELERFRGVRVREIACGSRQTCILTDAGHLYAWGWILHETQMGLSFGPIPPTRYLEANLLPPGVSIVTVTAGSAHMVITLSDGTIQVLGENVDNSLCHGHPNHADKVYPPIFVRHPEGQGGEKFKVTIVKEPQFSECTSLGAHLMHILETGLDSNITLKSPSGVEYHLHRFVLHVRCPVLLEPDLAIPTSPTVCKQLFDWVYGQSCDLSTLTACELVQLLQLLQRCDPYLGQLAVKAERTFVQLISSSKEQALLVALMDDIMGSRLGEWVKVCLCDHLKNHDIPEHEVSRVPHTILSSVAVLSHQKHLKRPEIVTRTEHSLEEAFVASMTDTLYADFEISFAQPDEPPLRVHLCVISRMAFFEALFRNMSFLKGTRKFLSYTPRSAMMSLLRYIYGGDPTFSAWDALYLMSPENGAAFYFAGTMNSSPEVELIQEAAQIALSEMDVQDAVPALVKAQELNNVQAEAVLIDLIADHYLRAEQLLESLRHSHGDAVLIAIHKQIIRSLLLRFPSNDVNTTQNAEGM